MNVLVIVKFEVYSRELDRGECFETLKLFQLNEVREIESK